MRWIAKAAAYKTLSVLPYGGAAYRVLQDRLTGTTARVTEEQVEHRIGFGTDCLSAMRELLPGDPSALRVLDMGAGWLPTIPLLLYSAGVEEQLLVDVERHMRLERLSELVETFRACAARNAGFAAWRRRLPPPVGAGATLDSYLAGLGIRYVAPYGADNLAGRSFQVATCTSVLHHLDERTMRRLLGSIGSSLSPGGLLLAHTPLHDPYALFDSSITPFNKWRYSEFVWERLVNSRMMSFNRLTISDYERVVGEGFEVVRLERTPSTPAEVEAFRSVRLHQAFASRPEDEFAGHEFFLVARKPGGAVDDR